jgi:hypothetical protein
MSDIKPLRRPIQLPVMQDILGSSLTLSAPSAILSGARIVSEGVVEGDEDGKRRYNGSTLVTVDLARSELGVDLENPGFVARLLRGVNRSLLIHVSLTRAARLEAERRATPYLIQEFSAETEFRIDGHQLLIDIYVECSLAGLEELDGTGLESDG